MTLGLALVIVLSFLVVALAAAVYHLTTRVSSLETAVDGGLRTPERSLTSDEFAARFTAASARAALARELDDGVAICLDGDSGRGKALLDTVAGLTTGRGITLLFSGERPTSLGPVDLTVRADMGSRFEAAGIVATPFGMTIVRGRVVEARLLGSDNAITELFGSRPTIKIEPTPLEVD